MIPDYNILEHFTVEEIDKIQAAIGIEGWMDSDERYMLKRREDMEVDILRGIIDWKANLPLTFVCKKVQQIDKRRSSG